MKCSRSLLVGAVLAAGVALMRAELPAWIQNIEVGSRLNAIFFRPMPLPSGPVEGRRPPRETRPALTQALIESPTHTELFVMRAREAELALDFTSAEADWKRFAELSPDPGEGYLALADFYHRRLRPGDEIAALSQAAKAPDPGADLLFPGLRRRGWRAFERSIEVIEVHALGPALEEASRLEWISKYSQEPSAYTGLFTFYLKQRRFEEAGQLIERYRQAFPTDSSYPVAARANLERTRGSVAGALAIYDQAFEPLASPAIIQAYFALLEETNSLRAFYERARSATAANPDDLNAAARLFHYQQQRGNAAAAQRVLIEFRLRKESRATSWMAEHLRVLAILAHNAQLHEEAARHWYALYSLAGASPPYREQALAGLTGILLAAPEQPLTLGSGNLSFYRDIATMDGSPGFLNGILSLLLNSTYPEGQFDRQETASIAYFHRAKASELLTMLDAQFPNSPERPTLHARLIETYETYGDSAGVLRAGERFLKGFPASSHRTRVSLAMAQAYARTGQPAQEFQIYDAVLRELSRSSGGVPLGEESMPVEQLRDRDLGVPEQRDAPPGTALAGARSPEYARVLDRYVARLVSMKRIKEALALYSRQIDLNTSDPGVYERLAAFLEQHRMAAETEQVYRRAIAQFSGRSWHEKLARWYLRRKQTAAFEKLTREVVATFSGSELEQYFKDVLPRAGLDAVLYRQVNLYAHRRFPHNQHFVHNLLNAYSTRGAADAAAWERLARANWRHDPSIRTRYLAMLAAAGRLEKEVRASGAPKAGENPAAAEFVAEGEAWMSHFEKSAPLFRDLSVEFPGDFDIGRRAASIHRSLGGSGSQVALSRTAIAIEQNLHRFMPRDAGTLSRIGEIHADLGDLPAAKPYWTRIAAIEPGDPHGYLEAATVFWDYYQFDEATHLIAEARSKTGRPPLFAYEAGAIAENQRSFSKAIEEYVRGSLEPFAAESPARRRLLTLARRPQHHAAIETATAKLVSGTSVTGQAVELRAAVLQAQGRHDDLRQLLLTATGRSSEPEVLDRIDHMATRQSLEEVRQSVLERRIAIQTDPVGTLGLRLRLARFLETQGNPERARQVIETVHREQPRILGVIRAATDFYWRNKMHDRAIETLEAAALAAHETLKRQFLFEAARKATDVSQYDRARKLLAGLLRSEPFHAEYMAARAASHAREGDARGLEQFYTSTMKELRSAGLPQSEKEVRMASLRRGLIPALARRESHAAALDQYIELIRTYPEDTALLRESGLYAIRHGRERQLLGYFRKASTESPKDVRWPVALARLETQFELPTDAIADYVKASAIRPDRIDLLLERASLEERLLRFGDAAATYTRIYELSYRDPRWMERVAEQRARLGDATGAVEALRRAFITGRPDRPENHFEVAGRLEAWNILPEARDHAERGMALVGSDGFSDPTLLDGASTYARVMTRLRRHEEALTRLRSITQAPEQAGGRTIEPVREIGRTAWRYFTPEEKVNLAAMLEKRIGAAQDPALLALIDAAGLTEAQARWLHAAMMASPGTPRSAELEQMLIRLQTRRMRFNELGAQLEAYWKANPIQENRDATLDRASEAYRAAGNAAAEIRALAQSMQTSGAGGPWTARYLELVRDSQPQLLVLMAAGKQLRDEAANAAVASGDSSLALRAIAARGRGLPPVWTKAYTALTGLYFASRHPEINAAFQAALGVASIGDRLRGTADRNQQIVGDTWFYYGGRYGEYMHSTGLARPGDYIVADLEGRPGSAAAYYDLAEFYRNAGRDTEAAADFERSLQLDPLRASAHDRMARIFWRQGRREDAVGGWRAAVAALSRQQDLTRMPVTFWGEARVTLEEIGRNGVIDALREEIDKLLRTYIRRNGAYQIDALLRGVMAAAQEPRAGVAWIVSLSKAAADPVAFLNHITRANWIPRQHREPIYKAMLDAAEERAAQARGEAAAFAQQQLQSTQIEWLDLLVESKHAPRAQQYLESLPAETRQTLRNSLASLELRIAAQSGQLAPLLESFKLDPAATPASEDMRQSAEALRRAGDRQAANQILEFEYTRQLERQNFAAATFLGLAEVKLEQGNHAEAVAVLRRMVLLVEEPFPYLPAAGALLANSNRSADAAEFLEAYSRAFPWDAGAKLRLLTAQAGSPANVEGATGNASSIAAAQDVPYEVRAGAARLLGSRRPGAANLGSGELDLLALGSILPAAAERPMYFAARIAAASQSTDRQARLRLLSGAVAMAPENPEAKLGLIEAALAAARPQLAVSAARDLLEASGLQHRLNSAAPDEAGRDDTGDLAGRFGTGLGLFESDRAHLAQGLAEAYERLNQHSSAEMLSRIAIEIEPEAVKRSALQKSIDALQRLQSASAENGRRRPLSSASLEQPNLVRPRVPTGASR